MLVTFINKATVFKGAALDLGQANHGTQQILLEFLTYGFANLTSIGARILVICFLCTLS